MLKEQPSLCTNESQTETYKWYLDESHDKITMKITSLKNICPPFQSKPGLSIYADFTCAVWLNQMGFVGSFSVNNEREMVNMFWKVDGQWKSTQMIHELLPCLWTTDINTTKNRLSCLKIAKHEDAGTFFGRVLKL